MLVGRGTPELIEVMRILHGGGAKRVQVYPVPPCSAETPPLKESEEGVKIHLPMDLSETKSQMMR